MNSDSLPAFNIECSIPNKSKCSAIWSISSVIFTAITLFSADNSLDNAAITGDFPAAVGKHNAISLELISSSELVISPKEIFNGGG